MNTCTMRLVLGAVVVVAGSAASGQAGGCTRGDVADRHRPLAPGAVAFDPALPATLEVKKARTGHLLVRPRVNGCEAGWFIFDTGAGVCVLSTASVDQLDLVRCGEIDTTGVGGSAQAPLYRARELTLGPMKLTDHPFMAVDLTFLEPHLGEPIAGVIGYGVLSKCVAAIDLAEPTVALHDPGKYALPRGTWTSLDLRDRVPVLTASFEGHEGRFLLDTGDHQHITFYEPAVRKWDLLAGRALRDGKIGGVGGFVAAKLGSIARLEFGGLTLTDVPASFALEAKGTSAESDRAGKIGAGVLERFLLVVDYGQQRIGLVTRPSEPSTAPSALGAT